MEKACFIPSAGPQCLAQRARGRGIRARVAGIALVVALPVASAVPGPTATATASQQAESSTRDRPDVSRGRRLIVGSTGTPNLAVLEVGRGGALTAAPGSPYPTGAVSLSAAITPDGRTVYSAHVGTQTILGYRLESDGSLSPLVGATVLAGGPVVSVVVDPRGKRLFATVGTGTTGEIRSFAISSSGGLSPLPVPPAPVESAITQLAMTPDGRHMIVTNFLTNTVSSFAVTRDGGVTSVGPSVAAGEKPVIPAFSPNGRYVYVSDEGGTTISGYRIDRSGRLTPTPGSPYEGGGGQPHGVAITPDGRHLYLADASVGNIPGFEVQRDGRLSPLPGSPFPGPGYRAGVGRLVLSPDARDMFVIEAIGQPHGTSLVHTYRRRSDGSIVTSEVPPADTGVIFSDGVTAFTTPNQGPRAVVRMTGRTGRRVTFSAVRSSDPDGRIASYRWKFGNGQVVVTRRPRVTHRFTGRPHRVILTVTDREGCSTQPYFNGTTMVCRGGSQAQAEFKMANRQREDWQ